MSRPEARSRPRNAVVVLLDSLNRQMLGAYGGTEFQTPHLDRFARRSTRFDRHYAGSIPCMPARHDILCGALDFLWKPWGSIEVWEDAITHQLRRAGIHSYLASDHPHLFESGGETKYARGHVGENLPLSMWSNRWSTMPIPHLPQLRLPRPDRRAKLDFMPGSDIPVIRQPFAKGDPVPYWALGAAPDDHYLFDLGDDPGERRNRVGTALERQAIDRLRAALEEVEAPADQLERIGLA